ncbi:vacuolar protein sorting-associated protein 51, putative [Plasmodium reichenowi]|uniref:Vacuolar protein sorting-associated protein 51, putative n=1 Tax=Plasmodium reichenowi TaxID=5854 RepID=A0A2P9D1G3_PLARE|nr:vacuolar protein sorting-associated protein 51, putative [Plasmodium reichenowi]
MENKSNRRKNVGSMLYNYYNIETRNNVEELEECRDNNRNNINRINNISKMNNCVDDSNCFDKNENIKEKSTIIKSSDNNSINLRRDENYENIDNNNIKECNEENVMDKMNYIDEFDMNCSNFNVNNYFKELLEKSSMYDLINKSKKVDKEIKQNDSCMQTLIYENYNKFINAADALVLLKEKFKCVKDKMKEINNHLDYIDKESNFLNNNIFINYEKIENLIEIKKLLNDINEIMKIPEYMYSYILKKKYMKSLKMFIKVIPFFHKNKDLVIFQNLYLDCNNLANIACHFFLKKLNKEKNVSKLPVKSHKKDDNKYHSKNDMKSDIRDNNKSVHHLDESKNYFSYNKYYIDEGEKCFYFFDNNNLEESFESLHSYVLSSEEVGECLNLVLSYGMDRKEIKKLYLKNRIDCLKYVMYNIFSLKNHGFFLVKKAEDFKSSFFDPNYQELHIDKENKKNDPKKNEYNKNNGNTEYFYNNIFENIFILCYKHLLYFFFSLLENYEKMFMKRNNFIHNFDGHKSCFISFFYKEGEHIDDKNLNNNIDYLRYLINNLDESLLDKSAKNRCEHYVMSYDNKKNNISMDDRYNYDEENNNNKKKNNDNNKKKNNDDNKKNNNDDNKKKNNDNNKKKNNDNNKNNNNDRYSYLDKSFNLSKKLLLNDLLNIDDDNKIIEALVDIFFKVLCKITIDYIYMFNPPIKLIVKLLKMFIDNVNGHNNNNNNNKIYYKDKILYDMNRFIKKIYYVLLKLYFYNLCFHINIYLYTYFQNCDEKKLIDILESKNELSHYILLKLCLTVMDFEPFYVEIKLENNFYVKHFFNFVIIYLESLSRHIDSFIYYFVCVHEKSSFIQEGDVLKYIKDEHKKEFTKDSTFSNNKGDDNIRHNYIHSNEDIHGNTHFDKHPSKDFPYFMYESADNIIYEDKENIFTHKNLYYMIDEENTIHCKHLKKKDEPLCGFYKKLKNYLYSSVCVDNVHMKNILVEIKKFMKMEYTIFLTHITGFLKFGKIKKIKEIYFLLCLVWIFHNIKREGVSKIFNVITDMYKEANDLINGYKRIDMGCSLDYLLHKDIYPFIKESEKEKEKENKKNKKLKLKDDNSINFDNEQRLEYTNGAHIFMNKNNEKSEDKKIKNLTFTYNEEEKKNKLYEYNFDHNNICGDDNNICGDDNNICGDDNNICGDDNNICGDDNNICGDDNNICGDDNNICDDDNNICGDDNNICSDDNNICGDDNNIYDDDNNIYDDNYNIYDDDYNIYEDDNNIYDNNHNNNNNNIYDNYSHERNTKNIIIKMTKDQEEKRQNINDKNRKKKYVIGISNFVKYKFNEKCNELTNVFISYYINTISNHIKLYVEKYTYEEDTKSNIVSYNFVYCMKHIDIFYKYLKYFIYQNKSQSVINFEGQEREYVFSDMYEKIEEEFQELEKKYLKDKCMTLVKNNNGTDIGIVEQNNSVLYTDNNLVDQNNHMVDHNNHIRGRKYILNDKEYNEDNKMSNVNRKEQIMENNNLLFDMNKDEKNLEMYMYKLFMLKMKNYRKKLPTEINKILLLIIKIVFKNYMEYIRKCHMNEKKLYKMQIDFFFFYHCLKHYIPCDDENVLFVILNEVLINAKGRIRGIQNKRDEDDGASSYQGYLLLDDIHIDLEENKLFILKMFKE